MEVVVNRRKIRDTVGQIVADGNRAVKQEARNRFVRMPAGTRSAVPDGSGFAVSGSASGAIHR